jgi:hypothetical protein
MDKKTLTPRPYLSWSQFNLFRTSKISYVNSYIYEDKFENQSMEKGKMIAEMLEEGNSVEDEVLETIRLSIPKFKKTEYEMNTEVAGVPLYGKFDGFDEKNLVLDEVKTGQLGWNQDRVDKSDQITFYCLMIYQKFGNLPKKIRLHYVPTEKVNGVIKFNGEVKTFLTKRTEGDILSLAVQVKRVWEEIKVVSEKEYKAIGKL